MGEAEPLHTPAKVKPNHEGRLRWGFSMRNYSPKFRKTKGTLLLCRIHENMLAWVLHSQYEYMYIASCNGYYVFEVLLFFTRLEIESMFLPLSSISNLCSFWDRVSLYRPVWLSTQVLVSKVAGMTNLCPNVAFTFHSVLHWINRYSGANLGLCTKSPFINTFPWNVFHQNFSSNLPWNSTLQASYYVSRLVASGSLLLYSECVLFSLNLLVVSEFVYISYSWKFLWNSLSSWLFQFVCSVLCFSILSFKSS